VLKRALDILLAVLGLVLFAPVMVVTALAIRISLGSPVLFRQRRPGLHGSPFELVKFRTMRTAVDSRGDPLPDEQRVTAVGRFVRATSLDELPELWNVLKGDMSIVGPRPLLCQYLPLYNEQQRRRHEVRPGITGWTQVNGRNSLSWEKRFEMDVWYIDNRSTWLDLRILARTLVKVVSREGINQDGHVTVEPFRGTGR
jgi:sugar transferase EpsL